MSRDFFKRYNERWLNTKLRSLGNMTPLQASKTFEGKTKLKEIFKNYENMILREEAEKSDYQELEGLFLKLRNKLGL